mmetsp:Transcript_565/g.1220  ORF Transcript_565/g.1220 Transcript_565/m.1220 type:complete len:124 (+) Transcript_565:79-450(+)
MCKQRIGKRGNNALAFTHLGVAHKRHPCRATSWCAAFRALNVVIASEITRFCSTDVEPKRDVSSGKQMPQVRNQFRCKPKPKKSNIGENHMPEAFTRSASKSSSDVGGRVGSVCCWFPRKAKA